MSGADLEWNARHVPDLATAPTVTLDSVERYLAASRSSSPPVATVIVDPPRTGMSVEAMTPLVKRAAPRLVYVSCDPPTLARDLREFLSSGYRMDALEAFDLFPNTFHLETVASLSPA